MFRIRRPIGGITRVLLGIVSFAILIGVYLGLSERQTSINENQKIIPGVKLFAKGFERMTKPNRDGETWIGRDARASGTRFLVGMIVGSLAAFVIGIAMGCYSPIEALFLPPIAFLASIPPTAMMVVYTLFLGLEFELFAGVIALGIFPTLAQSIYQAAKKDVSEHAIYKAYTLGASQFEVIWEVIIPQILPRIIDAIRLQVGPAMIFLIAAEYYYADQGFGYGMRILPKTFSYNVIFTYLIILGAFGMLVDWGIAAFRRWLCPWYGE